MNTRTDLLKFIIKEKQSKRYLEIGIQAGVNFDAINIPFKVGVEPFPTRHQENVLEMYSDQFFKQDYSNEDYDLVFIDGLHTYEQTRKDLYNALDRLNEGGIIVMHDALPHNIEYTSMSWCGTSYKAIMEAAQLDHLVVKTWENDHGCAVIIKNPIHSIVTFEDTFKKPTTEFDDLWKDNGAIIGKCTTEEIITYIKSL